MFTILRVIKILMMFFYIRAIFLIVQYNLLVKGYDRREDKTLSFGEFCNQELGGLYWTIINKIFKKKAYSPKMYKIFIILRVIILLLLAILFLLFVIWVRTTEYYGIVNTKF